MYRTEIWAPPRDQVYLTGCMQMGLPPKQGLYDPRNEHDSCGVGFVANIKGAKSHDIIAPGPADPDQSGPSRRGRRRSAGRRRRRHPDPDSRCAVARLGRRRPASTLPQPGHYAVAMCFLPREAKARDIAVKQFEHFIKIEGQMLLGWRDVPTDPTGLGKTVLEQMPLIRQAIIGCGPEHQGPGRVRAQAARHPQADAESAGSSWPRSTSCPAITAPLHAVASRPARWSTRACCWRPMSAASTTTCTIR